MKKYIIAIFSILLLPLFVFCANAAQIGDTDNSGTLSAADARLALRQSVSIENLDEQALIAADADNDNAVTAGDARLILRASIGLDRFPGALQIDFIDVGQAKSILVRYEDKSMLIDAGNVSDGRAVCDYLRAGFISTLDYVVCTHAHEDHVGGLADVLNTFTVTDTVFAPELTADTDCYENFIGACRKQNKMPVSPALGSSISFGDCEIVFYGPAIPDTTDPNNSSIVMKITYEDTSFLITGDAETDSEHEMIDLGFNLSADLLDVGHHGSSSSTSYVFLREVMPEFAVISCGKDNDYGHPHDEVTSRLEDAGVITYRTDLQGTIQVISNGKALAFCTENDFEADIPEPNPDIPVTEYIGNVNSKKFHLPTCGSLPAEHNRIYFATRNAAVDSGYSPCGTCKP